MIKKYFYFDRGTNHGHLGRFNFNHNEIRVSNTSASMYAGRTCTETEEKIFREILKNASFAGYNVNGEEMAVIQLTKNEARFLNVSCVSESPPNFFPL